jgi:hypothetical protein
MFFLRSGLIRKITAASLLGAALASSVLADPIDEQIYNKSERIQRLLSNRQLDRLRQDEKRDLNQTLKQAIQILKDEDSYPPTPPPPPPPPPPSSQTPASCGWYDGTQVSPRGWHATRSPRGYPISLAYYGNNAAESQQACIQAVLTIHDAAMYRPIVARAKRDSCGCAWYDGTTVGPRGWHMAYTVRMLDGGSTTVSSGYYSNNAGESQTRCNRDLAAQSFVCR